MCRTVWAFAYERFLQHLGPARLVGMCRLHFWNQFPSSLPVRQTELVAPFFRSWWGVCEKNGQPLLKWLINYSCIRVFTIIWNRVSFSALPTAPNSFISTSIITGVDKWFLVTKPGRSWGLPFETMWRNGSTRGLFFHERTTSIAISHPTSPVTRTLVDLVVLKYKKRRVACGGGRGWGTWCLDSSRKIRLQRYFVLGFPFLLLFPLLNRTGDSISFVATTDVCFVVMGSVLFWRFVSAAGKQCPRWPKRARFVQIWAFLTRAGETCLPNAFSWLLSQHASMPMDA